MGPTTRQDIKRCRVRFRRLVAPGVAATCPNESGSPSTVDCGAFQDPTHVSFWNSNSFWYYTRPEQARFINSTVLFEANRVKNFFPSDCHREHQIVYVKADLVKR